MGAVTPAPLSIGQYLAKLLEPVDRRPWNIIAREDVYFTNPVSIEGYFDTRRSRHLEAPLLAFQDPAIREVNVKAPPRSGKSLIIDAGIQLQMQTDPCNIRIFFQDKVAAQDHARERGLTFLRLNKKLIPLLPANRHDNTTMRIRFKNGYSIIYSGPAKGQMQSRGYRIVIGDEVWLWVKGRIADAKARVGDFRKQGIDKVIFISQGGEEESDWDDQAATGELNEWSFPCVKCKKIQIPELDAKHPNGKRWGLVFDEIKDDKGYYDPEACKDTARYECKHCGHVHQDTPEVKEFWNDNGLYTVVGKRIADKKTFHWWDIVDASWSHLIFLWTSALNAAANGNFIPKVTFCQKQLAHMKSEKSLGADLVSILRKEYDFESDWKHELDRILTIDCQQEGKFYYMARAWGQCGRKVESRRLEFGTAYSFAELEEIRKRLNIDTKRVFIDSGYKAKGATGVYAACVKYGWIATKGDKEESYLHCIGPKGKQQKVRRSYAEIAPGDPEDGSGVCAPLIRFSSNGMADRVDEAIATGVWVDPLNDGSEKERDYLKQLSDEYKAKERTKNGDIKTVRKKATGENHFFDCAKQQLLAATVLTILADIEVEPVTNKIPLTQPSEDLEEAA